MIRKYQFYMYPFSPTIPVAAMKKETEKERFQRLKHIADATGRRFLHVYLEDEKKRQGNQRRSPSASSSGISSMRT